MRPVGSSQEYPVDVRVVAATNRNLVERVKAGEFREDLYFRLNVVPLTIPPLRERPEDTKALVPFFLKSYAVQHNPKVSNISPQAYQTLLAYSWPGNVRELENTIERAVVLCRSNEIQTPDLMLGNFSQDAAPATKTPSPSMAEPISEPRSEAMPEPTFEKTTEAPLGAHDTSSIAMPAPSVPNQVSKNFHFEVASESPLSLGEVEKAYISHVCNTEDHSKEELADILGINRKTLYRKQKEYGIE